MRCALPMGRWALGPQRLPVQLLLQPLVLHARGHALVLCSCCRGLPLGPPKPSPAHPAPPCASAWHACGRDTLLAARFPNHLSPQVTHARKTLGLPPRGARLRWQAIARVVAEKASKPAARRQCPGEVVLGVSSSPGPRRSLPPTQPAPSTVPSVPVRTAFLPWVTWNSRACSPEPYALLLGIINKLPGGSLRKW